MSKDRHPTAPCGAESPESRSEPSTARLRSAVREELALGPPVPRRRSAAVLRLSAAVALAGAVWAAGPGAAPARAQGPYHQEIVAGLSGFDVGNVAFPDLVDVDGDGDLDAVVGGSAAHLSYFENTGSSNAPAFIERVGEANPVGALLFPSPAAIAPDLVDLDGDGDLDVVVGQVTGVLRYFENTGSSAHPVFVERSGTASPFLGIDPVYRGEPHLVDLDGDGDLDAVVGELPGTVRYLENVGSSTAPAFSERTGILNPLAGFDVGYESSPHLVDLDGDGDLDAVVGELNGPLNLFENTGTSSAPAFVERTGSANPFFGLGIGSRTTPELADLDGDGDFDAVPGEGRGSLKFLENTGTSSAPAFVQRTGTANPFGGFGLGFIYSHPDLVDLDGDGDLDAVVGDFLGALHFFADTGTPSVPSFVERTGTANPLSGVFAGGRSAPDLVDLDGDGDLDVVVGVYLGTLHFFENLGTSTSPAFVERTGTANPFNGVDVGNLSHPELADLDGDGDLDAVVGGSSEQVHYFENTGSSTVPLFVERTGTANPFVAIGVGCPVPSLADLDRDGDLDALIGQCDGGLRWFRNTGSTSAPAFVERTGSANRFSGISLGGFSTPALVDFDGDGDLDALVGEAGGHLVFFRSGVLFADGFESGDLSAWSSVVP